MSAIDDLSDFLEPEEQIEAIVFGHYGWNCEDDYNDPDDDSQASPVPKDKQGVVLTLDEAIPLMHGWSFCHDLGAPRTHSAYIWTTRRVIWVVQYDGATWLDSAPRNPVPTKPHLSGRS